MSWRYVKPYKIKKNKYAMWFVYHMEKRARWRQHRMVRKINGKKIVKGYRIKRRARWLEQEFMQWSAIVYRGGWAVSWWGRVIAQLRRKSALGKKWYEKRWLVDGRMTCTGRVHSSCGLNRVGVARFECEKWRGKSMWFVHRSYGKGFVV